MAFAPQLKDTLDRRQSSLESEVAGGADLRSILTRQLLAVEDAAATDLRTSVLLLEENGRQLRHGAAPNLPQSYCDAIDGAEIGPSAGSCGTAAFLGRPVYVTDIETDPLWADYREAALAHGLRACWSTPIFDEDSVLGTFAIYHPTPRSPTPDEVKSIALITCHVAEAIKFSRDRSALLHPTRAGNDSFVRVISTSPDSEFAQLGQRLGDCAASLRRLAASLEAGELSERVQAVARDCEALVRFVRKQDGTAG